MMTTDSAQRWDASYESGDASRSWYQIHASTSFGLISKTDAQPADPIVDVGGGASTLVDDLTSHGFVDLTVLDVSRKGLDIARGRLGDSGASVRWITDDLLTWQPDRTYKIWHDRAMLHFLTVPDMQLQYRQQLLKATAVDSWVVVGVFGPDGPDQCSGLPVVRFDEPTLASLLGSQIDIVESFTTDHSTPSGSTQQFLWALGRRTK